MGWVKPKSFLQNRALALFILFLSVIFFGVSLQASLNPPRKNATATRPAPPPVSGGRQLASISAPAKFGTTKVEKVKVGCLDTGTYNSEISSSADLVRLSGRICQAKLSAKIQKVEAKLSSKELNLVGFYQKHSAIFSTDFFALTEGVNTIDLKISLANGESRESKVRLIKTEK